MQSALADRRTTSHNRDIEGENVNTSIDSCRVAAWFNALL